MIVQDDEWTSLTAAISAVQGAYGVDGAEILLRAAREGRVKTRATTWHFSPPYFWRDVSPAGRELLSYQLREDFWHLIAAELGFPSAVDGYFGCFSLGAGDFDATIRCGQIDWAGYAVRGLRLFRSDVEGLIRPDVAPNTPGKRPRGRPKGSGWINDAEHIVEMRRLLDEGIAKSPNDAARRVAEKISGNQSVNASIKRLTRKYNASQNGRQIAD